MLSRLYPIILQAWLTLPSCLASSRSPTLARMIFWSVVMVVSSKSAEAGRFATPTAPRPASACDSPWDQDTTRQVKSQLIHVSVGHGVSLLQWRSGGVEHPHDTPPYPFMPSPTFVDSSRLRSAHKYLS